MEVASLLPKKSMLDIFVGNVQNNAIWSVMKSRYGVGIPYFDRRVEVACSTSCAATSVWSCLPCNINQWGEHGIINQLQNSGSVPKNSNAIYLLVLGSNVNYYWSQGGSTNQLCATHDLAAASDGNYKYITLPMPKSSSSACNVVKSIGYPNGDYALDSMAAIYFHELTEIVAPNYMDSWSYQIADKCANRFQAVGTQGTKGNARVGNQNYLIPPIWDSWYGVCTMGL